MKEHINLIRKIAWSFHHTTGMEWDELFLEASYRYVEALRSFDPDKGAKFSTYLWNVLTNHLSSYIEKEDKYRTISIDDTNLINHPAYNPLPFWERLTMEAQEIADYIIRNASEFVCFEANDINFLVYYIFLHKGWSEEKIRSGLNDLKKACSY